MAENNHNPKETASQVSEPIAKLQDRISSLYKVPNHKQTRNKREK